MSPRAFIANILINQSINQQQTTNQIRRLEFWRTVKAKSVPGLVSFDRVRGPGELRPRARGSRGQCDHHIAMQSSLWFVLINIIIVIIMASSWGAPSANVRSAKFAFKR